MTKTLKIKTPTLALLEINALIRVLDSPIYLVIFRILKTLRRRSALRAPRYCVPKKRIDIYFGIIDNKSIIQYKLITNLNGFFTQIILKIYSIVKTIVITHSDIFKKSL